MTRWSTLLVKINIVGWFCYIFFNYKSHKHNNFVNFIDWLMIEKNEHAFIDIWIPFVWRGGGWTVMAMLLIVGMVLLRFDNDTCEFRVCVSFVVFGVCLLSLSAFFGSLSSASSDSMASYFSCCLLACFQNTIL